MSRQSLSGNSSPHVKISSGNQKAQGRNLPLARGPWPSRFPFIALSFLLFVSAACRGGGEKGSLHPNTLRDVPSARLAYNFTPDVDAPPTAAIPEESIHKTVQADFDTRRKDDRLLRTVLSPDGQRALALYDTGETQEGEFRIDMYSAEGKFLRNLTPPELAGAFAPVVSWSPDGNYIAFIGRKSLAPQTPPDMIPETTAPVPAPTVAPVFAPVPVFDTEQIYVCTRDGDELRPLTTRNRLIYFYFIWSPDAHALAALACREEDWEARERESKLPAGRPRLIELDGRERLLDDELTEATPVWSPDSSKIATGFEADLRIYDAVAETPTQATLPLREPLLQASIVYDEKKLQSKKGAEAGGKTGGASSPTTPTGGVPVSFNPIVRLSWPEDKTLFFQTAYRRVYASESVNTFQRWHKLTLSLQSSALSRADGEMGGRCASVFLCYSAPRPILLTRETGVPLL